MGYLSEHCVFAPLTEQLHSSLTGFDCQREPAIQTFFRDEAVLNAQELMSKSYCFYKEEIGTVPSDPSLGWGLLLIQDDDTPKKKKG